MSRSTAAPDLDIRPDDDEVLNTAEAAGIARTGQDWIQRQCKAGVIPAVKLGKEYRITRGNLRRFLNGTGAVAAAQGGRKTARQKRRDSS